MYTVFESAAITGVDKEKVTTAGIEPINSDLESLMRNHRTKRNAPKTTLNIVHQYKQKQTRTNGSHQPCIYASSHRACMFVSLLHLHTQKNTLNRLIVSKIHWWSSSCKRWQQRGSNPQPPTWKRRRLTTAPNGMYQNRFQHSIPIQTKTNTNEWLSSTVRFGELSSRGHVCTTLTLYFQKKTNPSYFSNTLKTRPNQTSSWT